MGVLASLVTLWSSSIAVDVPFKVRRTQARRRTRSVRPFTSWPGAPAGQDGAVTATSTAAPLDPDVAAVLAAMPIDVGALLGGLTDDSIADVRAAMGQMPVPELSDKVLRTDHEIPGSGGVVVRVHRPVDAKGPLPCVYWMHGGGLVLGDYAGDDARFDVWCPQFPCVGVSVQYRLSPETRYPGPLDDCYAGLQWVHGNAAELGVDPARLGIGGQSAGGGLAAGLALLARDRGEVPVAFQLLVYPMIDDRQITESSQWHDPVWPPSANTYGWTAYLGDRKGTDGVEPYAAPARATDLSGLPPTLIAVGAIDGFSDEDIDYAVRLRHAGVPVDLKVYAGAPHGFEGLAPTSAVAQRASRDMDEWLGERLA
jgi:acetyl esterase/lipase